jgi:hypothetical protein
VILAVRSSDFHVGAFLGERRMGLRCSRRSRRLRYRYSPSSPFSKYGSRASLTYPSSSARTQAAQLTGWPRRRTICGEGLGRLRDGGAANWPPIIDVTTWNTVAQIRATRSRRTPGRPETRRTYLLPMLECAACGRRLVGDKDR